MSINGIDFFYILFEFTLFGLFSLLIYVLVKSYLLPSIYSEIANIKKRSKELKENKKLLDYSNKRINDKIENQRESFDLLNKKIEIWNKNLLETKQAIAKENERIVKDISAKRVIQGNNLNILNMQRVVIPKAIKQAYVNLKELYNGEKGAVLTKELINKIKP